jgi:hypothetical protein
MVPCPFLPSLLSKSSPWGAQADCAMLGGLWGWEDIGQHRKSHSGPGQDQAADSLEEGMLSQPSLSSGSTCLFYP